MGPPYDNIDEYHLDKLHSAYGAMPPYLRNQHLQLSPPSQRMIDNISPYSSTRQSRSPTYSEPEQDSANGQTRRRIPVAVS